MKAPESMTEFELLMLWEFGATKADIRDALQRSSRNQEAARAAHVVSEWRAANPQATCRPPVALILIQLEREVEALRRTRARA